MKETVNNQGQTHMTKQTLIKLMTLLALTFAMTACGGGGSTTPVEDNTTQPDNNNTQPVVPTPEGKGIAVCSGTDQGFSTATVLETAKEVKGLENDPSVRLWHLEDGTRKACVLSGSVEVL